MIMWRPVSCETVKQSQSSWLSFGHFAFLQVPSSVGQQAVLRSLSCGLNECNATDQRELQSCTTSPWGGTFNSTLQKMESEHERSFFLLC